jgi:hypothetical protein
MLVGNIINGITLGLLGFLVINESVKIRKLNDLERFLYVISNDIKDIKEVIIEQKEFNEFLNGIDKKVSHHDFQEDKNEETGEINPNLIYDDNTEEKSSDSSSDGWKEVRTDNENNCEKKNNECDQDEMESDTED